MVILVEEEDFDNLLDDELCEPFELFKWFELWLFVAGCWTAALECLARLLLLDKAEDAVGCFSCFDIGCSLALSLCLSDTCLSTHCLSMENLSICL